MQFSRCLLEKYENKVVLQGIIHGIPKPMFDWLKKDISRHHKNGYKILYEGIRKYECDNNLENYSDKELDVIKCFELINNLKEELIKILGLNPQFGDENDKGINYPKDAINIDISFTEFIRLIAEKDVDCKGFINILESIPKEKLSDGLVQTAKDMLNGDVQLKELDALSKSINFIKESDLIETEYRNSYATEIIDEFSKKRGFNKIYVQFGESHIDGMTKILVDKFGWKLVKLVMLDSEYPSLHRRKKDSKKDV